MLRLIFFVVLSWPILLSNSVRAALSYEPSIIDPLNMPWTWTKVEGLGKGSYLRCFDVGLDGTLWLGLHRGVAYYDGERLKPCPELSSEQPRSVDVTSDGSIYVTCSDALWRGDGDTWFRYEHALSISRFGKMIGAREAPDGRIWIASKSELLRVEGDRLKSFGRVADAAIADFDIDAEGRFWLLETRSGTVRCLRRSGEDFVEESVWHGLMAAPPRPNGKARNVAGDIFCAAQGDVWLVNAHGKVPAKQLLPGTDEWKIHDLIEAGGTHLNGSISQTSDGIIRITGVGMIHRRTSTGWNIYDDPISLRLSRHASRIKEAPDGSVWILEKSVRISRIDYLGLKWRVLRKLLYQDEEPDGSKWYMGGENSVVRHDAENDVWVQFGKSDELIDLPSSVIVRSDGHVWAIGSHKGQAAASAWDGLQWNIRRFPELGLKLVDDLCIESSDGSLLLVGRPDDRYDRLARQHFCALIPLDPDQDTQFFKIPHGRVLRTNQLPDGRLAFCAEEIFLIEGDKSETLSGIHRQDLRFRAIHDFVFGKNGELWVANRTGGIARLKNGQWTYFSEEDGLEGQFIADLHLLQNGEMACLTSKGFFRFDGNEWYLLRLPENEEVTIFSRIAQSQDGAIWLNLANRFWQRSPDYGESDDRSFQTLRYMPDTFPPNTEAVLLSKPEQYSRNRLVGWSGRDHGFEGSTQSLTFSYRIDGDKWSRFTEKEYAYLERLKPGVRQIEVRARDEDGNVDPTPAILETRVTIPYWETGWFFATVIVAAIVFAVLIFGLLIQRLRHVAALDRMRMRFLANISHELRTPLALIMGPLEVLASRNPKGSDSEKEASMALRNAGRLNELVDQLLELKKREFDPVQGKKESCDLVAFVEMLASDFDSLGRTAGQRVEVACNVESEFLIFDKDAYRKILDNLVMNAFKHSERDSITRIEVSICKGSQNHAKHVRITVSDEGSGISKNALPHIFEAFYSGEASRLPSVRSFGVGLALVKEIVDSNSGRISVQSPIDLADGQRGGARFTVEFDDVPCCLDETLDPPVVETSQKASQQAESAKFGRYLVLVAEDDEELRSFLSKQLSDDYDIIEARNGKEALDLAIKKIPDLVIADINMPQLTGLELSKALRASEATNHIPLILQTAMKDKETISSGFESGAIDFVSKPFSIAVLKGKIANLMESRAQFARRMRVLLLSDAAKEQEGPDSVFINRLQKVIDNHLADPDFNAVALATELGLSQSSCYRKVIAMLETSPGEFIKNYRLEKSVGMLFNGATASQAAAAIGYSDSRAYSRAFKKHFGHTPAGYKKAHRESD